MLVALELLGWESGAGRSGVSGLRVRVLLGCMLASQMLQGWSSSITRAGQGGHQSWTSI